jgi:hypothetical protein
MTEKMSSSRQEPSELGIQEDQAEEPDEEISGRGGPDSNSSDQLAKPGVEANDEEWSATAEEMAHWSLFGRRSQPPRTRVRPSAWDIKPFTQPQHTDWRIPIPNGELGTLLNGFLPEEMEDKLFIYADGPDFNGNATLHTHCSWTGKKYVELEIRTTGDQEDESKAWKSDIISITWEKDDGMSEGMAKFIALEACNWKLGVKLVDEIETPTEWKDLPSGRTIKMGPIAAPGETKTVYKGSTIDTETLEDLQRMMAIGQDTEVKFVQGYSATSEMSEARLTYGSRRT